MGKKPSLMCFWFVTFLRRESVAIDIQFNDIFRRWDSITIDLNGIFAVKVVASFEINFVKLLETFSFNIHRMYREGNSRNYAPEGGMVTEKRSQNKSQIWPADMRSFSRIEFLLPLWIFSFFVILGAKSRNYKLCKSFFSSHVKILLQIANTFCTVAKRIRERKDWKFNISCKWISFFDYCIIRAVYGAC